MKMCPCGEQTANPSGVCGLCQSDAGLFANDQKTGAEMKRFSLHAVVDMAAMKEAPRGAWVQFDDAWPRIAEAQDKLHKARVQLAAAKNTLEQIAGSYPVTDEGETLASLARDALKDLAK